MADGRGAARAALLFGLALGVGLGLVYTWVINPVELVNTYPALLRTDYRRDWVRLTALAYVEDGDLGRARTRLEGIAREDVADALEKLIESYAAAGYPADVLRRLSALAQAVGIHTPAMEIYLGVLPVLETQPALTPTAPLPSPTLPPALTFTPSPTTVLSPSPFLRLSPSPQPSPAVAQTPTLTRTATPPPPTPTPPLVARLQVAQQEQVCEPDRSAQIAVIVKDERGREVPGVEVWLLWAGGADRAVTGLKPQYGAGYVDFSAEQGLSYSIGVGQLGQPLLNDLRLRLCPANAETGLEAGTVWGSWRIVLSPPAER
jgi:hypothetical protein